MKTEILNLVRDRDFVTFVELSSVIPDFKGDNAMVLVDFPNIVLWPWVSSLGIVALQDLLKSKEIHICPASILVYMADGNFPSLDIAKGLRQYKAPRWLPITFSVNPPKKAKK